jgi:hypothetical protein
MLAYCYIICSLVSKANGFSFSSLTTSSTSISSLSSSSLSAAALTTTKTTTCLEATNNNHSNHHHESNRRTFLTRQSIAAISLSIVQAPTEVLALEGGASFGVSSSANTSSSANASASAKPFAPPEALLPATRLKIWTDQAYEITSSFSSTSTSTADKEEQYKTMIQLNQLLSSPPKLFLTEKILKRTSTSTAQITSSVSNANKDQYQLNRKNFNMGDKISAMLNQADVERQWGMLQYEESKREESNQMRAAFNYYTQQLNFDGDRYNLTASKEDRKKMIRNDDLPTLTAVITSDLDLRDLYRNQFLTAIEDVQAEVAYQAKQSFDLVDVSDTEELMKEAFVALSQWFDLIPSKDVEEAIASVTARVGS